MSTAAVAAGPDAFATFGDMLLYLRRRARMKQRDLAIATGYSEAQISRLEKNQRLPDRATLAALFIPALDLEEAPDLAGRLLELAMVARSGSADAPAPVLPPPPRGSALPPPALHEVPRPNELARLRARLASERHVALCGLPGTGKTTLAASLAREHAEHAPVFWLTLSAHITSSADNLIHQLATFLHAHGQAVVTPLLQTLERSELPLNLDRQITMLGAGLSALIEQYPRAPLICFDNFYVIQYDRVILQIFQQLMATTVVQILILSRESPPLAGVSSMALGGLQPDESTSLLERLAVAEKNPPIAADLLLRLQQKAAGNPMLLRFAFGQLLGGQLPPDELVARLETHPEVSGFLLGAIRQRLSPAAWHLVSLIATLRRPVDLFDELLVELSAEYGEPYELGGALAEIQRLYLIDNAARADLHPLVRDYIYAALVSDLPRRRRLHRIAAEWTERARDDVLLAAYHYARADDLQQAVEVLIDRAEMLRERGLASAAIDVIDELLVRVRRSAHVRSSEMTGPLLVTRGDLLAPTTRVAEAEADYRSALQLAGHPAVRGRIAARLALSLVQRGQADQALALCSEARQALGDGDTLLRLDLVISESWALRILSRYDELIALLHAAMPLAERLAEVLPREASRARSMLEANIAYVHYTRRRLPESRTAIDTAYRIVVEIGPPRLVLRYYNTMAHIRIMEGNLRQALELTADVPPRMRALGDSFALEYLLCMIALAHYLGADTPTIAPILDEALALRQALGITMGVTAAEGFYVTLLIGVGRLDQAHAFLDAVLARVGQTGEMRDLAYNLDRLAALQLLAGDAATALSTLERAQALPAFVYDPRLHAEIESHLGLTLALTGDTAAAASLLDTEPEAAAGPWAALERHAAKAAVAVCTGDPAAAALLDGLEAAAIHSDHLRYRHVTDHLRAAHSTAEAIDVRAVARLLWVDLA